MKKLSLILLFLSFGYWVPVAAQQIIPAEDGTATLVRPDGQRIIIDGGSLSRDGKNLFHSFQEFGLSAEQIATFLSNPNIKNILSRVVGGNPSYINGLIEVMGGNSNLFLVNPSGILFGSGARLNIPGSFTATTADKLGFENGTFNALGPNDYLNLVGTPHSFQFEGTPGNIVNAGVLAVPTGNSVSLVGGTVVNTGTINAPGGQITVATVPGASTVKISQQGKLLSLEVNPPRDSEGNVLPVRAVDLPTLLTGAAERGIQTGLAVTTTGDVQMTASGVLIPDSPGTTIISGTVSTVAADLGGEINLLGDRLALVGAVVDASGTNGGGQVLIGGDFQGKGSVPNAQVTVVDSGSTIKANAINQGDGGKVIVWADGNTVFTGNIEAKGGVKNGDGGFVEVSGKENLYFNGQVDTTATDGNFGTLLLDPENVIIVEDNGSSPGQPNNNADLPTILAGDGGNVTYTLTENALEALFGTTNVTIEATQNITINNFTDPNDQNLTFASNITTGSLTPDPRTSVTFRADADNSGSGNFVMDATDQILARGRNINISGVDITVGTVDTSTPLGSPSIPTNGNAGNITLTATGNIAINGQTTDSFGAPYSLASFVSVGGTGNAGNISLNSTNGSITIAQANANLTTTTTDGNAGNIELGSPNGTINLPSSLQFGSFSNSNNTGNVTLTGNAIQPGGANTTLDFVVNNAVDINTENFNVSINNTEINLNSVISINGNNVNITQSINTNSDALTINATGSITTANNTVINAGAINLNTPGQTILGSSVSSGTLTTDVLGTTQINADVTTTGNQTYNDAVTLNGDRQLTGQNVALNNTVTGAGSLGINASGQTTLGGTVNIGSLTTDASGTTQISSDVTTTGNQTYNNAVILNGDRRLTAGGTISDGNTGSINATGQTILNANTIILDSGANNFNQVTVTGQNATLVDGNSLEFVGNSNITNDLTVTTVSDINEAGTASISVGGLTTLTATNIGLEALTNNFNQITVNAQNAGLVDANTLDFAGSSNIPGNLGVTAVNITDSGRLTVGQVAGFSVINDLILDSANNDFNTVVLVNANNVSLADANNLILTNLDLSSNPIPITLAGDLDLQVAGVTTVATSVNAATFTTDNSGATILNGDVTTTGNQTYNDAVTLNGDRRLTGGGTISDGNTGSINATGQTILNANTIILDSGVNNFNRVTANAQNVNLTDIDFLSLGNSTIPGNLTLTLGQGVDFNTTAIGNDLLVNARGNITDSGVVTVGGTTTLNAGTNDITLDSAGNDFNQITVNAQNANIIDINSIEFIETSLIFNNLTLNVGENITEGSVITVNGVTTINAGGNVELDSPENDFNQVTVNAPNATLVDANNLEFVGNSNITNDLAVTTVGDINEADTASINVGGLTTLTATDIGLEALTNDFNQITVNAQNVGLVDANTLDFAGSSTVTENLGVAAVNITDSGRLRVGQIAGFSVINDLILDSANNDFNTVVLVNANNVSLADANNLILTNLDLSSNPIPINLTGDLDLQVTGVTTVATSVNAATFTTDNSGATILNGDVTTKGNQTYNDGVTLNGDRRLTAGGNIKANSLANPGQGINISAQNINTGNITSAGGNISLTSTQGNITTQNLNSGANQGGNLKLKSATNVTTGAINTSGANGNAGDITIQALQDIEVTNINAQSSGGQGGTVFVQTPSQIRVTGTVPGTNASVITIGSLGGGDITLQYDGDPNLLPFQRTPFIVGDATVNGSAGELTSGDFSINSGEFYFNEQRGNVAIISVPSPITGSDNPSNVIGEVVVNVTPTLPASPVSLITIDQARNFLQDIEKATAEKPAVIYVNFKPRGLNLNAEDAFTRAEAESSQEYRLGLDLEGNDSQPTIATPPADSDELDLVIVTAEGEPVRIPVQGILRQQVLQEAEAFWKLTSDELSQRQDYEPFARRLYQWLITPLEPTLSQRKINNLLFVMPLGLRVLPVASLIDPEGKFLVEKYSSGFAPSLSLNNNAYKDVKQRLLLAMGASQFVDPNALGPLPAVDVELPAISNIWGGKEFYPNQDFTIDNLRSFLETTPYGVIHISTHAEFDTDKNYIQFYDNQLALEQIRTLGLNRPSVELLVLSACRTAIGNETAELGFAGLAVKAGVKSVLASLWWVGDTGTVAFMTDFYRQLKSEEVPIKAEALRKTQINMLKGRIRVEEGKIITSQGEVSKQINLQGANSIDLTHPYYWAPFTLIGSPW